MTRGEIYLAQFPFGDAPGMKIRPVLLLKGAVGPVPEVIVAYISSVVPSALLPSDVMLDPSQPEQRGTRLKALSVLRLHKLATIHATSLRRRLGALSPADVSGVASKLRLLLQI